MPFFLTLALAPTLLSTSEAKSLNVYSEEKLEKGQEYQVQLSAVTY